MPDPPQRREPEIDELGQRCRDHLDFVWRILRRLGVRDDELQDTAQDVLVAAVRNRASFEGRASFTTWLFGIAQNIVLARRRATSRRIAGIQRFEIAQRRALQTDPMEVLDEHRDAMRVLDLLLAQLPEDKRSLYILVDIEKVSIVDIAAESGVNVNTLHTRLRSARKLMKAAAMDYLAEQKGRCK